MTERPLFSVDFNELVEPDLVLLSKTDIRKDASGNLVELVDGLPISIYEDDVGPNGSADKLVAEGFAIPNATDLSPVKWCCRISPPGIRHQSDLPT